MQRVVRALTLPAFLTIAPVCSALMAVSTETVCVSKLTSKLWISPAPRMQQ
jgi:hypothetical protein